MKFKLGILGKTSELESAWTADLISRCFNRVEIQVLDTPTAIQDADVIFVDQNLPDIEKSLNSLNRKKQWVILVTENPNFVPPSLSNSLVDDVLVYPFRTVEVVSKFKALEKLQEWKLLKELNLSFGGILKSLEESYRLAERAQKAALPRKFPKVKGFKVFTRYFAGLASGGDYFDLFEMEGDSKLKSLCLMLSHSSTYRLSSAVMNAFTEAAESYSKRNIDSEVNPSEFVEKILSQLRPSMQEKDQLSLCLAVISRAQGKLNLICFGENRIYYSEPSQPFREILPSEKKPRWNVTLPEKASQPVVTVRLSNKGRLAFISPGFLLSMGGEAETQKLLNKLRENDPIDFLNELAFQTKSKLSNESGLPAQDCTAIVIDIDSLNVRAVSGP